MIAKKIVGIFLNIGTCINKTNIFFNIYIVGINPINFVKIY